MRWPGFWGLLLVGLVPCVSVDSAQADQLSVTINQIDFTNHPRVNLYTTIAGPLGSPLRMEEITTLEIREDGTSAENVVIDRTHRSPDPLACVLAIDRSGSMRGKALEQAVLGATTFVRSLRPDDSIGLVLFDHKIERVVELTRDRARVLHALHTVSIGGDTALTDAALVAVRMMTGWTGTRRAVVLLTDGKDTRSKSKPTDVALEARRVGVAVHTIAVGAADRLALQRLSEATGGVALTAAGFYDLDELYRGLGELLANQRIISFTSPAVLDGQWHEVELTVTSPRGRGSGRLSYPATLRTPVSGAAGAERDVNLLQFALLTLVLTVILSTVGTAFVFAARGARRGSRR